MKSMLSAVVLSVLLGVALSSDCTNLCQGSCNMAMANCQGAMVLGPLCGVSFGACSAGCATVCGCDDGCGAQCAPQLAECNTQAGNNIVFKLECAAKNDACVVTCEGMCAVQTAIATLQGGAAPRK